MAEQGRQERWKNNSLWRFDIPIKLAPMLSRRSKPTKSHLTDRTIPSQQGPQSIINIMHLPSVKLQIPNETGKPQGRAFPYSLHHFIHGKRLCVPSVMGFFGFIDIIKCDASKRLDRRQSLQMYNILVVQSFPRSLNLPPGKVSPANHCLKVPKHLQVVPALNRGQLGRAEDAGQVVLPEVVPDEDAEDFIMELLFLEGEEGAVGIVVSHEGLDGLSGDEIGSVIFEEALIGVELPQGLLQVWEAQPSYHAFGSLAGSTGTPQVGQDDIYCVGKDVPIFQLYIIPFLILKFECPFAFLLQKKASGWMLLERRAVLINRSVLVKVIKVILNLSVRAGKKGEGRFEAWTEGVYCWEEDERGVDDQEGRLCIRWQKGELRSSQIYHFYRDDGSANLQLIIIKVKPCFLTTANRHSLPFLPNEPSPPSSVPPPSYSSHFRQISTLQSSFLIGNDVSLLSLALPCQSAQGGESVGQQFGVAGFKIEKGNFLNGIPFFEWKMLQKQKSRIDATGGWSRSKNLHSNPSNLHSLGILVFTQLKFPLSLFLLGRQPSSNTLCPSKSHLSPRVTHLSAFHRLFSVFPMGPSSPQTNQRGQQNLKKSLLYKQSVFSDGISFTEAACGIIGDPFHSPCHHTCPMPVDNPFITTPISHAYCPPSRQANRQTGHIIRCCEDDQQLPGEY